MRANRIQFALTYIAHALCPGCPFERAGWNPRSCVGRLAQFRRAARNQRGHRTTSMTSGSAPAESSRLPSDCIQKSCTFRSASSRRETGPAGQGSGDEGLAIEKLPDGNAAWTVSTCVHGVPLMRSTQLASWLGVGRYSFLCVAADNHGCKQLACRRTRRYCFGSSLNPCLSETTTWRNSPH